MKRNTWVVIPAHNEVRNIVPVLLKLRKYDANVVVVDDGSTDNTSGKARHVGVTVLRHLINLGKGAALKTGCDYAVMHGAKRIIVMDADGQHDPKEIRNFLKRLSSVDIVLGFRRMNEKMPRIFKLGNWFINRAVAFLFGIKIRDTQCGFRAFTKEAYKKIRWNASDYSMESEMIAHIGKTRLRYAEVPIETIYADRYKGTTILDGIKIVLNMLIWRLRG
jgi:glycosyltransferase involved in cell wall biosynthesis